MLDTGPLLGLLDERDQHHEQAIQAFSRLAEENATLLCPMTTALEVHRNLLYVKPPMVAEALTAVQNILEAYPLVTPQSEDVKVALKLLERYPDQTISLFDGITASLAKRTGARVLTFDVRHFALLGAELYR